MNRILFIKKETIIYLFELIKSFFFMLLAILILVSLSVLLNIILFENEDNKMKEIEKLKNSSSIESMIEKEAIKQKELLKKYNLLTYDAKDLDYFINEHFHSLLLYIYEAKLATLPQNATLETIVKKELMSYYLTSKENKIDKVTIKGHEFNVLEIKLSGSRILLFSRTKNNKEYMHFIYYM